MATRKSVAQPTQKKQFKANLGSLININLDTAVKLSQVANTHAPVVATEIATTFTAVLQAITHEVKDFVAAEPVVPAVETPAT